MTKQIATIFLLLELVCILYPNRANAQAPTPLNNLDPLTATASAPVTVKRLSTFTYPIMGTDSDTYTIPNGMNYTFVKLFDTETLLIALTIRSGSRLSVGLRGTIGFTRTWDVAVQASYAAGVYLDDFQIYNNRIPTVDVLLDTPVGVQQTVIVTN